MFSFEILGCEACSSVCRWKLLHLQQNSFTSAATSWNKYVLSSAESGGRNDQYNNLVFGLDSSYSIRILKLQAGRGIYHILCIYSKMIKKSRRNNVQKLDRLHIQVRKHLDSMCDCIKYFYNQAFCTKDFWLCCHHCYSTTLGLGFQSADDMRPFHMKKSNFQ